MTATSEPTAVDRGGSRCRRGGVDRGGAVARCLYTAPAPHRGHRTESESNPPRSTPPRRTWKCDRCHELIANRRGHILADIGWPNRWAALHTHCSRPRSAHVYPIEAARIRTTADVADWRQHLTGKTWFDASDWDAFIRRQRQRPFATIYRLQHPAAYGSTCTCGETISIGQPVAVLATPLNHDGRTLRQLHEECT